MREFCEKFCKGYQQTRLCYADGQCESLEKFENMTYDEQTRILKPAAGKYITNGTTYGTEAKLAPGDSPENWREIDVTDVPNEPSADEYANTEPEE